MVSGKWREVFGDAFNFETLKKGITECRFSVMARDFNSKITLNKQ